LTFKARTHTLFLDRHSEALLNVDASTQFNIILSPTLYWVKLLKLPVRSVREARALLPSIFEESIADELVSYYIKKVDDHFIAIAYSDKTIVNLLAEKGLKSTQVRALYFAQFEIDALDAVCMNEQFAMIKKEGIVIALPRTLLAPCEPLDLQKVTLSKNAISLARYAHLLSKKQRSALLVATSMLMVIFSFQWYYYAQKRITTEQEIEAVYTNSGLQATSFQNRARKKALNKVYRSQLFLRQSLQDLLAFTLLKGEYIEKIDSKKSTIIVTVKLNSEARLKAMMAKIKGHKKRLKKNDGYYVFEVKA